MYVQWLTYVHMQADIALFGESLVRRQILERFFARSAASGMSASWPVNSIARRPSSAPSWIVSSGPAS